MSTLQGRQRLLIEAQRMRVLMSESSIMTFHAEGEAPRKYRVIFHGSSSHDDYLNEHELEIWLGPKYPDEPPEIRLQAPLFHPNLPRGGQVDLDKCGLTWKRTLMLDQVCQRLWDVARLAYIDFENVANESARRWFQMQRSMTLPVDSRSLRDQQEISWGAVREHARPVPTKMTEEPLYIDEKSPQPAPQPTDDDDILYIE